MTRPTNARFIALLCIVGVLAAACKSDDDTGQNTGSATGDSAVAQADGNAGGDVDAGNGGSGSSVDGAAATTADGGASMPGDDDDAREGNRRPEQECPATRPANGTACVPGRGDCTIGAATCECSGDTSSWVCWEPSDCPAEAPAEGAACGIVGIECEIPMTVDMPEELDCECTPEGWDCGRQLCPAAEPELGGACDGGDGVCAFGDRVCDCKGKAWVCWNASDCPAAPPLPMSACPVERMQCLYPGDECDCRAEGWECESEEEEEEEEEEEDDEEEEGSDAGMPQDASMGPDVAVTDAAV